DGGFLGVLKLNLDKLGGNINSYVEHAVDVGRVGKFLEIEILSDAEMIIPLEVNRAKSWLEQIETQLQNLKHDLQMAELTFIQTVNLKELPSLEGKLMLPQRINIDPQQCLEAALKHRPEIYLSKLLTKFNEYAKKIETNKKNSLTVDLTSSYGFYEGHYKTEPWRDSSNWYAGIKFTKPLGASTLNSAYTREETQPRFGQTSPTGSGTLSMEFNLLDNFKRASDKKKADIDFHRSLSDFNETLKTIEFEVQESIYNYQRALLQLNSAETEMKFRRNEVEVTKIRALVGELSLSGVLETLFLLAEAQTRYIQALANYQISLANLRKACGYGIDI
ncbi:MAG: TolC family protein, partial [Candidatus Omnitrophica bacterium]|nr:TolC family protein [Candidatus Omnitrophota bacterium]